MNRSTFSPIKNQYIIKKMIFKSMCGSLYKSSDIKNNKKPLFLKEIIAPKNYSINTIKDIYNEHKKKLTQIQIKGLPKIKEIILEGRNIYILSNWVDGKSLDSTIKKYKGNLFTWDIINWIKSIAYTTGKLHINKPPIIHGNINPKTIIIKNSIETLLLDLGITNIYKDDDEIPQTPSFRAPETFEKKITTASDVYSLCAIAYYLLTGIHPSQKSPFVFFDAELVEPSVPYEIAKIIHKGLSFDYTKRYKNCIELLEDLKKTDYTIPRRSKYKPYFNCPNCSITLKNTDNLCKNCNLDIGIFEGAVNSKIYYDVGKIHLKKENYETAERYFYQALRFKMSSIKLYLDIIKCHQHTNYGGSAYKMLINLKRAFPEYLPIYIQIIDFLKNPQEIDKIKKEIQLKFIDSPWFQLYKAREFFKKSDFKNAKKIAIDLLSNEDEKEIIKETAHLLTKIYLKKGEIKNIPQIISKFPIKGEIKELSYLLAIFYIDKEKWNFALNSLKESLKQTPLNWEIFYKMGLVFSKIKKFNEAINSFFEALRYIPPTSNDIDKIIKEIINLLQLNKKQTLLYLYNNYLS